MSPAPATATGNPNGNGTSAAPDRDEAMRPTSVHPAHPQAIHQPHTPPPAPDPGPLPHDAPGGDAAGVGPEGEPDATPLRKAAILLVSLEQPLASQLLAQLDRGAVEAVTLEIARLERVDPAEQQAVLEEFYGLGLRRLRFVFEDLVKMDDTDIREAYHDEDARAWALALAGAARPLRARVLSALPADASEALRQALDHLGPFRLGDAESAQAEIAERFRRLHDHGRLTLPDPNGQEEILV